MSYWMEIHCDAVMPGTQDRMARSNTSDCRSFINDNPAMMCNDPKKSLSDLQNLAVSAGWQRTYEGWICSGCNRAGRVPR